MLKKEKVSALRDKFETKTVEEQMRRSDQTEPVSFSLITCGQSGIRIPGMIDDARRRNGRNGLVVDLCTRLSKILLFLPIRNLNL